jgi:predicted DNA-binding protein
MEVNMPKTKITVFIDPELVKELKKLSANTRVPMAEYVREGIGMVLMRYQRELKKFPKERR